MLFCVMRCCHSSIVASICNFLQKVDDFIHLPLHSLRGTDHCIILPSLKSSSFLRQAELQVGPQEALQDSGSCSAAQGGECLNCVCWNTGSRLWYFANKPLIFFLRLLQLLRRWVTVTASTWQSWETLRWWSSNTVRHSLQQSRDFSFIWVLGLKYRLNCFNRKRGWRHLNSDN